MRRGILQPENNLQFLVTQIARGGVHLFSAHLTFYAFSTVVASLALRIAGALHHRVGREGASPPPLRALLSLLPTVRASERPELLLTNGF